jgi:HNH endonuclease
MGSLSLQLQWVLNATPKKAEDSFFKINQAATPIDQTELRILKARRSANAIASRVITRNATGHKYWAAFENGKSQIEDVGRELYRLLFHPPIETPIKTLDLPVAGRGYSSQTLPLIFETVNLANGVPVVDMTKRRKTEETPRPEDKDGSQTLDYLYQTRRVVQRITGIHPSSLGLHPAIYFYSATGRHQPTSFLAVMELVMEMERENSFRPFTDIRQAFEEFLLENKSFANQVTVKIGSGPKGFMPLKNLYKFIIDNLIAGKNGAEIIALLSVNPSFRFLTPDDRLTPTTSKKFSRETKSATFLKEALQSAIRCKICGGFLHFNSISIDHIVRKADGGLGVVDNAQLSHPYCNSTYKN